MKVEKKNFLFFYRALVVLMFSIFVISIPLSIRIHSGSVIVLILLCVASFNWKEIANSKSWSERAIFLFGLQFLIIICGLLHSKNQKIGLNDLERAIYPIAIIPIIYIMRSNSESIFRLLKLFSISCIVVALFGISYSWVALDSSRFSEFIQQGHVNFLKYTGIQPLYLSIYLLLILFFLVEFVRTNYDLLGVRNKLVLAGASFLVILIIIFLRSKTSIILLPALLFIYSVIVLKRRGWLVVFLLMFVGLTTFLLDRNNSLDLIDKYGAVSKAFDQRLYIWKGAIEGIKASPWIGSGTGSAQELLNSGYAKIGYQEGIDNQFNAHNQYLQFMARNGLPELLCFLAILAYSFWRSTKQSNYTFLMFNILVSLVMLTESFLSVQKGIVFFYFFLLAFIYLPEKKQVASQI
jgi:O-antigen ligase